MLEQVTLGLCLPSANRLCPMRMATGCPLCIVKFDETDQPPITVSATRFMLFPTSRPRPMGNCAVRAAASRLVALFALKLFSWLNRSSACGPPTLYHPTQLLSPEELSSVERERV